ncbi:type IV pilin protein [Marinobacteraceae bacterium S3BR75-40.1]
MSNAAIKQQGFTLIELMIVVAIIGVIAAIAVPNYMDYVERSRRTDAQAVLTSFSNALERYYTQNGSYVGAATTSGTFTDTPAAPAPSVFPDEAPLDGSTKFYNLRINTLQNNSFEIRAIPKGAQAGDGFLELHSTGQRGWDRDDNGTISASEQTWSDS